MARSGLKRGGTAMLLAVMSVSLAACGSDAGGRVGGGAAGGAATGATFGLIGGPIGVLVGGAIGGGIGALTAANTTPKQVDLGKPLWNRGLGGSANGNAAPAPGAQPAQPGAYQPASGQYGSGQSGSGQPAYGQSGSYRAPQPLTPSGGAGTEGIQSQPLAPPSNQ